MKERAKGFLRDDLIPHDSEQFDYIRELHDYLWRVVRLADPSASGSLRDYLPHAIDMIERLRTPVTELANASQSEATSRLRHMAREALSLSSQHGHTAQGE